jgi:hypothetical protein
MARTDKIYHDHTSVLCEIRLFTVWNIKRDIFERILERSRMRVNFLVVPNDSHDPMN